MVSVPGEALAERLKYEGNPTMKEMFDNLNIRCKRPKSLKTSTLRIKIDQRVKKERFGRRKVDHDTNEQKD